MDEDLCLYVLDRTEVIDRYGFILITFTQNAKMCLSSSCWIQKKN